MNQVSLNSCPLHNLLSGSNGALPQDGALCPDCAGPSDEQMCCAAALIRFLAFRCTDPMALIAECRQAFAAADQPGMSK